MAEKVDAVVIGSGAAGSLLACRLAEAGKRVVILEAGPERTLASLTSSQIWARRLKWGGAPVIETGSHPVGHNFNVGWGTGGTALHHYAVWPRLHAEDFDMASRFGRGTDWPISYEDLRHWYDEIQREVGVSGDHRREKWRPPGEPYSQPPVPVFNQGRVIARGFEAMGMATAPIPLAVRTTPEGDRKSCIWDGWCDAGCPIGALANPLVTHLPRALNAGAVLYNHANVTAILTNADHSRATGVVYRDRNDSPRQIDAELVILAASTIQNSRMLLASPSAGGGLANGSGLLGRNITIHLACQIFGIFDEDTQCYMGATGGQLINQDGYRKDGVDGAFGSYQWLLAQAMKPNDLLGIATSRVDLFGKPLQDFMVKAVRGFAMMTGVVEDLPQVENRVTLDVVKDRQDVPLAAVSHTAAEASVALWQHAQNEGLAVFEAAGANEAWGSNIAAMHNMGGTQMGNDPQASVTDSFGRCHDLPNLVVAGASLFPTSGGVNPTFTVLALASRTANHLLDQWAQGI